MSVANLNAILPDVMKSPFASHHLIALPEPTTMRQFELEKSYLYLVAPPFVNVSVVSAAAETQPESINFPGIALALVALPMATDVIRRTLPEVKPPVAGIVSVPF
ncbi:MAG: hypothetical protein II823_05715 [Kiritimatiellae bacterium]|nr:hypothetical protein [Kiritimatiellia bacterium]